MHNQNSLLKGILKRLSVYLLVVFMVLPVFFVVSFEDGNITIKEVDNPIVAKADAATVTSNQTGTWVTNQLSYSYKVETSSSNTTGASGSVAASGTSATDNTLTVKATSANQYDTGGCNSTTVSAAATTTTVTVTNIASFPLQFKKLTASGATVSDNVKEGGTIGPDKSFTITVTSPANGTNNTTKTGTVTVTVEAQTNLTLTLLPSPYTEYTVKGTTVTQNGDQQTISAKLNDKITLPSLNAPEGYEFKGWLVDNSIRDAGELTVSSGHIIFPAIVSKGFDVTAQNFKVGSSTYTFWEDAVKAASISSDKKIVVNLADVTFPDNIFDNLLSSDGGSYVKPATGGGVEYIVPSGVTLLVPYNDSGTVSTTEPGVDNGTISAQKLFRKLTVPQNAKITVASGGALCVNSRVFSANGGGNGSGSPHGAYGQIVMEKGSNIDVSGNLYAWGYITAKDATSSKACGTVTIRSSAKVYECFQVADQPGGSAAKALNGNSYGTFFFNKYYIQNIEVPMTLYYGAIETVYTNFYISSSQYGASATLIGTSSGLFRLSSGYITKTYDPLTDRTSYDIYGNSSVAAINIKVSSYSMNTESYILPINCNMDINVHSPYTTTLMNKMELHPSVRIKIDNGATAKVSGTLYVFDAQDWSDDYFGPVVKKLVPVYYSPTKAASHNASEDAMIDVNGTLEVSGKMYTTQNGADIKSTEGTGKVTFTADPGSGTATMTKVTSISGSSWSAAIGDKANITFYPPKLHNGPIYTGDDEYTSVSGTGASTWKYDKDGDHWYRYLVDFEYNGASVGHGYYCENNDTVTYDASWLTGLSATASSGTATVSGTNVNVTGVTADSTVTLNGTPATYIPTFVLSENEYKNYHNFTGNTITNTTTIGGKTYYIVDQATSDFSVGDSYPAPTDAAMGVSTANHNGIKWNMTGIEDSGAAYAGKVPVGETAGGAVYIYGYYSGVVAYNSGTEQYYSTLLGAFNALSETTGDVTITLVADCGSFEEESGTTVYPVPSGSAYKLDLDGYKALGRILNGGNFTLELNGGILDYHTGATAADAAYKGMAAVINTADLTVQDSVGGGKITTDAISNDSGANGTAVIRNNAGATMEVIGKAADELLLLENTENVNNYNYGIYNLGTITDLTYVDITTPNSGTVSVNLYNYNTGVISKITGGHMFSATNYSVFNYGGTIGTIDGLTIDGKYGVLTRNIRTGAIASGYTVTDADKGIIDTIQNCHIEVGQYAINNNAIINTVKSCTLIAHPDTAQVDTRGNGLATASEGNVAAYTVYNSANWWYDTNVWKRVDTTKAPFTRTDEYKEGEQYRPTIGQIIDCEIYSENTTTSASYGDYSLVNSGGVINKIGGTTNIKTYKHPDNTASITTSHYAMQNLAGGIIKSIEGTVNISATGIGTVYNTGVFTTKTVNTYNGMIGGNVTNQVYDYGDPSTILSVTCSGTWSCGSYYALYNTGYIQTINAPNLTLTTATSGYYALYNSYDMVNKHLEYYCEYTDAATASTAYHRHAVYTKNTEKSCTIGTINGITLKGKYYVLRNSGHIGTLSNVNISTLTTSNDPTVLNGVTGEDEQRIATVTEDRYDIANNASKYPKVTISSGFATRYDREYTYADVSIDLIDNLTVNSTGQYAFRNNAHIGTFKNSTITATTSYALYNSNQGALTTRQSAQYYSGTSIWATTKSTSNYSKHYTRDPSTIDLIDNCTIQTNTSNYAAKNTGHIGTIKNSTFTAGVTTASQYTLINNESTQREYTLNLDDYFYCTANGGTACTAYWAANGETKEVVNDYDQPTIDLIGEGNVFKGKSLVIVNNGKITEINSGSGTKTQVIATAQGSGQYALYNYDGTLDARTTTTPYTAASATGTSGTAGTAVNSDTYLKAYIGTIKNVYMEAQSNVIYNGNSNGSASVYVPSVINEIGEGAEFYGKYSNTTVYNKTTTGHIKNITGGIFTAAKSGANVAFKNDSTNTTLISGGDFKSGDGKRTTSVANLSTAGSIAFPEGKTLSTGTESVNLYNGTAVVTGTGYYYITDAYTVSFSLNGKEGTPPASQTIESGLKATKPTDPSVSGFAFGGWYKEAACTNVWDFSNDTVTKDTTLYAKWTVNSHKITWLNYDGTEIEKTDVNDGEVPSHAAPIKAPANTDQYTYTFAGWSTNGTDVITLPAATADATYKAVFTETLNQYTITFKDGDGNTIQSGKWNYGATPTYSGSTPTKTQTAQYTYTFNNSWSPAISTVTGNQTYTAQFNTTTRRYTVTWKSQDGLSAIETDNNVAYGTSPSFDSAAPTKAATAQYTYTFAGWATSANQESGKTVDKLTVQGDTTYYAAFSKTVNKYTITFVDGDGNVKQTGKWNYGATPSYNQSANGTPTKTQDAQYTYEFNNTWSPAITSVTGDKTYTAQFDGTTRSYNITFVNDGETVQTDKDVEYGQTAAVPEDQTKTTDSQYTYEFAGWQDEDGNVYASADDIPLVEGEATYTAYYEKEVNKYEVQWVDDTGTPLQTDTAVPYGTTPEYKQETVPTKPATPEHYYEFSGWEYSYTLPDGVIDLNDPSKSGIPKSTSRKGMTKGEEAAVTTGVVPVIGISTFTAKFTEYDQKYTVKWQNDGVDLVAPIPDLDYQAKVSYSGDIPTKAKTAQYTYTFYRWNYEYTEFGTNTKKTGHIGLLDEFTVLADTVFTADFSKAINYYNVTWKNWDGTVLSGPINTAYNSNKYYSGTPSRAPQGNIAYVFTGWDYSYTEYGSSTETTGHINPGPSIQIKADTVLTATYEETDRDYNITWKQSIDGEAATTARTTKVLYNAHPVPNASDEYVENCYFIGWYDENDDLVTEFPIPTADAVYTAKFVSYFQKHSLTLDGEIGTNFFVSLPDGTARKTVAGDQIADGYSIRYSWGNKWIDTDLDDSSYTYAVFHYGDDPYTASDDSLVYSSTSNLYRGTVKLAPKEIHDYIYAELCYNGNPIASETYKASTYLYQVIDYSDADIISLGLAENNTEADDLKALCKATLAYGASAQVYFMYHSGSLADSGLVDPFTHTAVASAKATEITGDTVNARFGKSVKAKALEMDGDIWENNDFYRFTSIRNHKDVDPSFSTGYYGSSMTVETDATYTIYFYYGVGELFDVTATINGVEHEVTRQGYSGGDFVGFDIHDIASAELTDDIQVTFTSRNSSVEPCTFTVNPCVYLFNICQFETEDTKLVDLAANIFNYNQLAIKYFSNRATTP